MFRDKDKKNSNDYPSLYDAFELGDRVKRTYTGEKGDNRTYRGIVLAIKNDGIEVYWDTKDGRYRPVDMDVAFTHCQLEEVYNGTKNYGPIQKE